MVFVNSQKFACASCIKGHRSSSCHHTDRPLFEIKKKGRPISQCERCRQLRKNKHMHVKCTCKEVLSSQGDCGADARHDTTDAIAHGSAQRKPPSYPTLPNGLRDLWSQGLFTSSVDAHPKQTVDALLNPCECNSVWKCQCSRRDEASSRGDKTRVSDPTRTINSLCVGSGSEEFENSMSNKSVSYGTHAATSHEQKHLESSPGCFSSYPRSSVFTLTAHDMPDVLRDLDSKLHLPPLKQPSSDGSETNDSTPRVLPSIRSVCISAPDDSDAKALAVASLTQCGCGSTCACPGCKQHRGDNLATLSGEDCPDRCGSCIDHMSGIALPSPSSITTASSNSSSVCHASVETRVHSRAKNKHSNASMSTLDHFYAIAALLPPPPRSHYGPGLLDPTNVAVCQQSSGRKQDWRKAAGLVQVPPLNCCEGMCKCPGMCGCGTGCSGSCGKGDVLAYNGKEMDPGRQIENTGKENGPTSCCARNKNVVAECTAKPPRNILRL